MIVTPWQCLLLLQANEDIPVVVYSLTNGCALIMFCTLVEAIAFYYRALSAGAVVAVFPSEIESLQFEALAELASSSDDTTTYPVVTEASRQNMEFLMNLNGAGLTQP